MAFEFPATGGVFPYQKIDTVNLLKYTTKADYFLWATEFVFCIYIVYYIIEERYNDINGMHQTLCKENLDGKI